MATSFYSGPLSYAVFAFHSSQSVHDGLTRLLELADSGIIEILDLEVVGPRGPSYRRDLSAVITSESPIVAEFTGAESGILDDDDRESIAALLDDDENALVVVYEDRTLAAFAHALAADGGRELFIGGVDIAELDQQLDAEEGAAP